MAFISAGNVAVEHHCRYPDSNDTDSIQDPAQAWNAITVGAYTSCVQFPQQQFPGYQPLGKPGDLSPSSTTSLPWFRDWPFKPDIVLEGGNLVIHPETRQVMDPDEMAILTTAHAAAGRLLVPFRDTSAATAQAARMAAMRVTLSYFIEPKPGRRGAFARTRQRYQSHGLRFEVRRPLEDLDESRQRINKAARDEDEEYSGAVGDAAGWVLGPNLRTRGSIHSDWWRGTAADLATCGNIAVYPVTGWWREKTDQDYWARHARYSLLVSIRTEATIVDLYTPVSTMIEVPTPVEVDVEIE